MKVGDKVISTKNERRTLANIISVYEITQSKQSSLVPGISSIIKLRDIGSGEILPGWCDPKYYIPYSQELIDSYKNLLSSHPVFEIGDLVYCRKQGYDNPIVKLMAKTLRLNFIEDFDTFTDYKVMEVYKGDNGIVEAYDLQCETGSSRFFIPPVLLIPFKDGRRLRNPEFMQTYTLKEDIASDAIKIASKGDVFTSEGDYLHAVNEDLILETTVFAHLFTKNV